MQYSLIINLSQDTVMELNKGSYTLCCFLACQSPNANLGKPLCWGVTKTFLNSVRISWQDSLCGYISTSSITENASIYIPQPLTMFQPAAVTSKNAVDAVTASTYQIQLHQRMLIQNYGAISIDQNNSYNTVLIQNNTSTPYSSGIGILDNLDNKYYGICALNLFGNNNIQIAPVNKAFLMFSSKDVQHNTVISVSESAGMLIDFNGSIDNTRTVSYDINCGWSSNQEVWGVTYPGGTDLKNLLIY